ncbi:MarR family winged helix-turn-helix transcriptional regulator [Solwaraspora sp. WMMD1047]|uniref:MarR family winged helix-turn-helix transcriptional regulator n=1 Tax=Solwaraspora sp. WMMD1047 TaxID=3016102 RepID=UPI002416EAA0|nr:MarR family winged helix-turn-helix transcriptional regulator [Solwaraspora sp. WMMD1047]MDG4829975.1 MarR family winged helix-turn-helix transcriptional regulator [Solwaraspora sp. WMMD1047]
MTANINLTPGTDEARSAVAAALWDHPGLTSRKLAGQTNLPLPVVTEALSVMEAAGTATRTPDPSKGNRRAADTWEPVAATDDTPATTDEATPDPANGDATPDTDDATTDPTPDPANEPTTDDAPTTAGKATPDADASAGTPDEATLSEAPVSGAPVSGAPAAVRQPDLKVLIMAGVLGGHPDGITADKAINESGLSVAMGDTILAAMEVAGAARRLPVTEDGDELWVIADGDLTTVDPANAPTHTTCPTCGHTRKIRRPSARRTTGTGRPNGEINSDGSAKLGKNELRNRVEAFMRDLGPGHDVTPGTVAREVGGRSPGAVRNGMAKLTGLGVLVLTREAPETYALADDAPAPTAEVRAFMTPPQNNDIPAGDEAGTDEAAVLVAA